MVTFSLTFAFIENSIQSLFIDSRSEFEYKYNYFLYFETMCFKFLETVAICNSIFMARHKFTDKQNVYFYHSRITLVRFVKETRKLMINCIIKPTIENVKNYLRNENDFCLMRKNRFEKIR